MVPEEDSRLNHILLYILHFISSNFTKAHVKAPSPFRGLGFDDRIDFAVLFLGNQPLD